MDLVGTTGTRRLHRPNYLLVLRRGGFHRYPHEKDRRSPMEVPWNWEPRGRNGYKFVAPREYIGSPLSALREQYNPIRTLTMVDQ